MMNFKFLYLLLFSTLIACGQESTSNDEVIKNKYYSRTDTNKINVSNQEWKLVLSPDLYAVSREKDTERPFTGKYWNSNELGTYYCAACGNELFDSDAKFSSSCGWPSFFEQKNKNSIVFKLDTSHGMKREEAICYRCGGHLGHLFDDGPQPTGKRYCMNSIALEFVPKNVQINNSINYDTIVLGGGCYWCVEAIYEELNGVVSVQSGFSGGSIPNPTYNQVCMGNTNHAEVVQIVYNSHVLNFQDILKVFFTVHDPTTLNRQGADVGTQYRSIIFYTNENQKMKSIDIINSLNNQNVYDKPIVTKVERLSTFYIAEDYHQDYYKNNKEEGYCRLVIQPKIEKFEKVFKDKLK